MTSRVTQCPNCQTSFRVTDAQLEIANGAVRCGSCLHIFNATEHWLGQQHTSTKPASTAAATPPNQSFDNELRFDDELGLDDIDLDEPDAGSEFSAMSHADDHADHEHIIPSSEDILGIDEKASNFSSQVTPSAEEVDNEARFDDDDILIDDGDDRLIEHLGEQMDDRESYPELELSDSFLDLDNSSSPHLFHDLKNLGDDADEGASDDWVSKLLEDDEADHEQNTLVAQSNSADAAPPEFDDLLDDLPSSDSHSAEPKQTNTEAVSSERFDFDLDDALNTSITAGERIGSERPLLSQFEPEPLEIATNKAPSKLPLIGWSLAITATLAMLAGQFLYFNFAKLSRDDNWRPLLNQSCQWLGCEVPERNDIRRIQLSNLIVRSHPTFANALVVDAIVSNRAPFIQAFPALELRFTDIEGQAVASRRFQPGEYLAGELSGSTMMPVKQPIHIGLEIVDPGPKAINYQLIAVPLNTP